MNVSNHRQLLAVSEGGPDEIVRRDGKSPILLICEHASNRIPASLRGLGLKQETLFSHAAWDPGALATSMILSDLLDATLVFQRFSRLVYDCNRPPESPTAMPERSEVHEIPGNRDLDQAAKQARVESIYLPFHRAVDTQIALRKAAGRDTVVVTMHSFTPIFHGKPRAVELGLLHDTDSRLADRMLEVAAGVPQYRTERNEPYGPQDGVTHTLQLHGIKNGLENVMIEMRNDVISDDDGQIRMARYLAKLLREST